MDFLNLEAPLDVQINKEAKRRHKAALKFSKRVALFLKDAGWELATYVADSYRIKGEDGYIIHVATKGNVDVTGFSHYESFNMTLQHEGNTHLVVKGEARISDSKRTGDSRYYKSRWYGDRLRNFEVVRWSDITPEWLDKMELGRTPTSAPTPPPYDKKKAEVYGIHVSVDGKILTNPEAIAHDKEVKQFMTSKGWL